MMANLYRQLSKIKIRHLSTQHFFREINAMRTILIKKMINKDKLVKKQNKSKKIIESDPDWLKTFQTKLMVLDFGLGSGLSP